MAKIDELLNKLSRKEMIAILNANNNAPKAGNKKVVKKTKKNK